MSHHVMERFVAPEDLAELLSVTTRQLAPIRYLGTGPEYVEVVAVLHAHYQQLPVQLGALTLSHASSSASSPVFLQR